MNTVFSAIRKISNVFSKCERPIGTRNLQHTLHKYKIYIGQTGKTITIRVISHIKNQQWDKSTIAEHRTETDHTIEFEETKMVVGEQRWSRLCKEAIKIQKNPINFNRDHRIELSRIWKQTMHNTSPYSNELENYKYRMKLGRLQFQTYFRRRHQDEYQKVATTWQQVRKKREDIDNSRQ